jgi:DNA-binding protein H-NS
MKKLIFVLLIAGHLVGCQLFYEDFRSERVKDLNIAKDRNNIQSTKGIFLLSKLKKHYPETNKRKKTSGKKTKKIREKVNKFGPIKKNKKQKKYANNNRSESNKGMN